MLLEVNIGEVPGQIVNFVVFINPKNLTNNRMGSTRGIRKKIK